MGTKNAYRFNGGNDAYPSQPDDLRQFRVHSAGAVEKAAAAQRASETRRKLLRGAAQIDGAPDAGEILVVGKWSDDPTGQPQRQSRNPQQNNQPVDEGSGVKPISVWA
jgi:hypothetical protein